MRVRPVDCGPLEMGWTDWLAPMVVYAFDGGSGCVLFARARGAGKAARARVRVPLATCNTSGSPGT